MINLLDILTAQLFSNTDVERYNIGGSGKPCKQGNAGTLERPVEVNALALSGIYRLATTQDEANAKGEDTNVSSMSHPQLSRTRP